MTKKDKLPARLFSKPKDFGWSELKALLKTSRERPTRMTDAFICRPSALREAPRKVLSSS